MNSRSMKEKYKFKFLSFLFKSKWLEIQYPSNYTVICKIEVIVEEEHRVCNRDIQ